jgi:hypothetical protein
MVAASSTDVNAQLVAERRQPSLEGADNTCRDTGGMPVHAHHGTKGLKPERIGQPPQQLVASIVVDNRLRHNGTKARHPVGQPTWNVTPVQRRNQPVVPSVSNPFGSLNQVACSDFVIWLGESEQQGNMDWTKGPTPQDVTGKYVVVWEKVEGNWKLAADIWTDGKYSAPVAP